MSCVYLKPVPFDVTEFRTAPKDVPGTIDDTAEEVTRRGGNGIAVACDHRDAKQVEALFARVREEQKYEEDGH
jgi:hypothetical protein